MEETTSENVFFLSVALSSGWTAVCLFRVVGMLLIADFFFSPSKGRNAIGHQAGGERSPTEGDQTGAAQIGEAKGKP